MSEYRDLENNLIFEIERRMLKNCRSGSFEIDGVLLKLGGGFVGPVVDAIHQRAAVLGADIQITFDNHNGNPLRATDILVEWSR